jgi:hypothetical protein
MTYDVLQEQMPARATKEYLRILELAAKDSEEKVDEALLLLLEREDGPISADAVKQLLAAEAAPGWREVNVAGVDLRLFDELCGEGTVQ